MQGKCTIQSENCRAQWLTLDPLPEGTHWIMNPMIHSRITQISDPMNLNPEWTDLKMDSLK